MRQKSNPWHFFGIAWVTTLDFFTPYFRCHWLNLEKMSRALSRLPLAPTYATGYSHNVAEKKTMVSYRVRILSLSVLYHSLENNFWVQSCFGVRKKHPFSKILEKNKSYSFWAARRFEKTSFGTFQKRKWIFFHFEKFGSCCHKVRLWKIGNLVCCSKIPRKDRYFDKIRIHLRPLHTPCTRKE